MSHKRHVWETVSSMASRLGDLSTEDLAKLEKEMGKLGREQYKANTLAQAQAERLQAALEVLQAAMARQEDAQREAAKKARLDTLTALLPVLDGLEAGLQSGARQARQLHQQASPAAAILIAWLDGQRLLRDRFLALLAEAGIQPIATIGNPFDPYRHVAVGTVENETLPDGQIVGEERRGYAAGDHVLRYAEVVVVKNPGEKGRT
jgi:molecular chaperone GrpE